MPTSPMKKAEMRTDDVQTPTSCKSSMRSLGTSFTSVDVHAVKSPSSWMALGFNCEKRSTRTIDCNSTKVNTCQSLGAALNVPHTQQAST